jgi:hypothetical protein
MYPYSLELDKRRYITKMLNKVRSVGNWNIQNPELEGTSLNKISLLQGDTRNFLYFAGGLALSSCWQHLASRYVIAVSIPESEAEDFSSTAAAFNLDRNGWNRSVQPSASHADAPYFL